MAFISCIGRLIEVLAGAAREMGSKDGGGRVRLSDIDTRELVGFQNKLICRFILVADMVRVDIQESTSTADESHSVGRKLLIHPLSS